MLKRKTGGASPEYAFVRASCTSQSTSGQPVFLTAPESPEGFQRAIHSLIKAECLRAHNLYVSAIIVIGLRSSGGESSPLGMRTTLACLQKRGKRPRSAQSRSLARRRRESLCSDCSQSAVLPSSPGAPEGVYRRMSSAVQAPGGVYGGMPSNSDKSMGGLRIAGGSGAHISTDDVSNGSLAKVVQKPARCLIKKTPVFHLFARPLDSL